jgi:hypothetical protein
MKRVKLDKADRSVQKFFCSLPEDVDGVELGDGAREDFVGVWELNGRVLCKVIPPLQFSDAEKAALVQGARELVRRARERNKGVPARVLEREVREAVKGIRSRHR